MATIGQIKEYFKNKSNTPCPITEKLVKAGYQQQSGGYIDIAINKGILVDYKQYTPSQYWHLMNYCDENDPNKKFPKSVVCGELIFWMAEVSGAFPKAKLLDLADRIISEPLRMEGDRPVYDRNKWNAEIKDAFFNRIIYAVENNKDYSKPPKRHPYKDGVKWWEGYEWKDWWDLIKILFLFSVLLFFEFSKEDYDAIELLLGFLLIIYILFKSSFKN